MKKKLDSLKFEKEMKNRSDIKQKSSKRLMTNDRPKKIDLKQ